tara:strand:+ start:524 stop:697 length:174 start_codon:yes stop_codon:yes gene_type:complete
MKIESAKYNSFDGKNVSITATIDEENLICIPLDPDNRDYVAILEWEKEDGNEIQAAE